jgi:hypothetical protein
LIQGCACGVLFRVAMGTLSAAAGWNGGMAGIAQLLPPSLLHWTPWTDSGAALLRRSWRWIVSGDIP